MTSTEQARRGPRPWSPLPPNLSEKDWQQVVLDLAGWRGWRGYHTHDSRRSAPGFPDLILCRGPRLLALELKRDGGRPTRPQLEWLHVLGQVPGVEARIVRPADWPAVQDLLA